MTTITTASGRTKDIPADFHDPGSIVGLDPDGRIVVDNFGAMAEPAPAPEDYDFRTAPFIFALTLCCNASDKGVEDGVVCRGCYSYAETGNYIWRAKDGSWPGLDPRV